MDRLRAWEETYAPVAEGNHRKVLQAFREAKVSADAFHGSTGYGYQDYGKRKLEEVYARIFKGQAALVSGRFASGTHAIHVVLRGLLDPGDQLVSMTGQLYDTLEKALDHPKGLIHRDGVVYRRIEMPAQGGLDLEAVRNGALSEAKIVIVQRSRGYSQRKALSVEEIARLKAVMNDYAPKALLIVDNCYGEFVEDKEPLEAGADLVVGSLIKNPGGTLAISGAYVAASRKELIEAVADSFTVPGIGDEIGWESAENLRLMFQGLYLAPGFVEESLKAAEYAAIRLSQAGYTVSPEPGEKRGDIIQSILLLDPDKLVRFIQGIQAYSPVDSQVKPIPWDMPGYDHPVIMASGSFIGGSSSELSADAPIRPPFVAYLQGGVRFHYSKAAIDKALEGIEDDF